MQQTAQAIAAAIEAGKAVVIVSKASDQDVRELGLVESQCHSNAEKFVKERGGEVVRGWLVAGPNYYITHSIVELNGVLHEVTPISGGPYEFVAASDVADGVWRDDREWSQVMLQPEDPSSWLAG